MAEKITADYSKMKSAANEMEELSAQLEKQLDAMDGHIEELTKVWESESAKGYINNYRSHEPDLLKLAASMRGAAQKLTTVVNNYTQTDNQAREAVQKLMGG